MKKFVQGILSKIGIDKFYHFIVGFFIYLVLLLVLNPTAALIGVCFLAVIGEISDYFDEDSEFDLLDIVATVLPATLMYIIL